MPVFGRRRPIILQSNQRAHKAHRVVVVPLVVRSRLLLPAIFTRSRTWNPKPSVHDQAHGSETLSLTVHASINDNATGYDSAASPPIPVPKNTTDNAAGSELLKLSMPLADGADGSETLSLRASIPVNDTAHGSEVVSAANLRPTVNDNASGSETVSIITAKVSIQDQAFGAEILSVNATDYPILTAYAKGSETLSVTASGTVNDSAHGSETVVLQGKPEINDTAHGSETISVTIIKEPEYYWSEVN